MQFATTAIDPLGDELRGDYARDGSRRGSFRMARTGTARSLKGDAKSDGQRLRKRFLRNFGELLAAREPAVRNAADRERARAEIRAALEESIRHSAGDPEFLRPEIESLTRAIERHMLDGDESAAGIDAMLEDGRINP